MDPAWLTTQFEATRDHLRAVALRMLGSSAEADDAVQETWLRLQRSDVTAVENLSGWLTTVAARVCLDMLRARKSRAGAGAWQPEPVAPDAARDLAVADSVAAALLVVLETLSPAERVAFVLHDLFDMPFDEIGRIVDRSEAATRQLASRARRRVQRRDTDETAEKAGRAVVDAFLAAARTGDLAALLAVLDPNVVVRADDRSVRAAAASGWAGPAIEHEMRGAEPVAALFKGRAAGASRATIDGEPGAAWVLRDKPRSVFVFTLDAGRIAAIDLLMEPDALAELAIEIL